MKEQDAATRAAMNLALDLAGGFQDQFPGQDLRLVAEVMMTTAASVAGFMETAADRALINTVAFAAAILSDKADDAASCGSGEKK